MLNDACDACNGVIIFFDTHTELYPYTLMAVSVYVLINIYVFVIDYRTTDIQDINARILCQKLGGVQI